MPKNKQRHEAIMADMSGVEEELVAAPGGGEGPGGAAGQGASESLSTSTEPPQPIISDTFPVTKGRQDSGAVAGTAPKSSPISRPTGPRTSGPRPAIDLATLEQQEAFAELVVDQEGIKPACEASGLKPAAVFAWAGTHPEFRRLLNAALSAVWEAQAHHIDELCNDLLDMSPEDRNKSANAYGKVIETRMRMLGKLLPVIYGDRPGNVTNIQNNVGLMVDEETRQRLIALREQILIPERKKELEMGRGPDSVRIIEAFPSEEPPNKNDE